MKADVKPQNITLPGFSRGGMITALASGKLAGRVLSVYETSDRFGTCRTLIDRSENVTAFTEIAISTGKEHGAFFTPRPEGGTGSGVDQIGKTALMVL